jgi:hypothetical protein
MYKSFIQYKETFMIDLGATASSDVTVPAGALNSSIAESSPLLPPASSTTVARAAHKKPLATKPSTSKSKAVVRKTAPVKKSPPRKAPEATETNAKMAAAKKAASKPARKGAAKKAVAKKSAPRKAQGAKPVTSRAPAAKKAPAKKAAVSKSVRTVATAKRSGPVKAKDIPAVPAQPNPRGTVTKVSVPTPVAKREPVSVGSDTTKKMKLVRDSFTMPHQDYALIAALKERALEFKRPAKKSEFLRAGLHALAKLTHGELGSLLNSLTPLKAGRPKKKAN